MAEPGKGSSASQWKAVQELGYGLVGVAIGGAILYFFLGFILKIDFLKSYSHGISLFRFWSVVVITAFAGLGQVLMFLDQFRAINTNEKVAAAIGDITDKDPGKNISEITADDVAASLKGARVPKKALDQLVEQHKQQRLIDPGYFRKELGLLIVDYLQPLPRNVKRLWNRFSVNLLIADRRGLFTTEPKVTTQQLGKWLVLMERWPQLGRALSTVPDRMQELEEKSSAIAAQTPMAAAPPAPAKVVVPPDPAAGQAQPAGASVPHQTASGNALQAVEAAPLDPFMESIRLLAPFYVGDEDLRKFIHSEPSIAGVTARLAHFGTDELTAAEVGAPAGGESPSMAAR